MNRLACEFAVVRFLPYPETQEFVNVGLVMACPEVGMVDYRLETHRRDRVTDFFPEMDRGCFMDGRRMMADELERFKRVMNQDRKRFDQLLLVEEQKQFAASFHAYVRPRESVFRYSPISVALAADPASEIERLFQYYVRRQFAVHPEYQEQVLADRLRRVFRERQVQDLEPMSFGDDMYRVGIPFVRRTAGHLTGIKPLHFDKSDTTRILDYGDHWLARLNRLYRMETHPEQLLLVVHKPSEGRRAEAANIACEALRREGVSLLADTAVDEIVNFARSEVLIAG